LGATGRDHAYVTHVILDVDHTMYTAGARFEDHEHLVVHRWFERVAEKEISVVDLWWNIRQRYEEHGFSRALFNFLEEFSGVVPPSDSFMKYMMSDEGLEYERFLKRELALKSELIRQRELSRTIVAFSDNPNCERILRIIGVHELVDHVFVPVLDMREISGAKCAPCFRRLFALLEIEPHHAIMCGDTPGSDIQPAIEAGMPPEQVFLVKGPEELVEVLERTRGHTP